MIVERNLVGHASLHEEQNLPLHIVVAETGFTDHLQPVHFGASVNCQYDFHGTSRKINYDPPILWCRPTPPNRPRFRAARMIRFSRLFGRQIIRA